MDVKDFFTLKAATTALSFLPFVVSTAMADETVGPRDVQHKLIENNPIVLAEAGGGLRDMLSPRDSGALVKEVPLSSNWPPQRDEAGQLLRDDEGALITNGKPIIHSEFEVWFRQKQENNKGEALGETYVVVVNGGDPKTSQWHNEVVRQIAQSASNSVADPTARVTAVLSVQPDPTITNNGESASFGVFLYTNDHPTNARFPAQLTKSAIVENLEAVQGDLLEIFEQGFHTLTVKQIRELGSGDSIGADSRSGILGDDNSATVAVVQGNGASDHSM